ncbi:MAG: helix-turn-helix transcriptional regulator [Opitutales bacterium]|nr:helix-turn-helix transcriptional regulator [Opitutales bacterium]MCH8540522.1 helix-turn-helix domain-containing protein [Opitutales bacterium]
MSGKNLIGPKVRELRIELGYSQEVFAAKCNLKGWDISRGTLSKIEAQLRRVNDAETFILAAALKCSVQILFESVRIQEAQKLMRNSLD